MATKKTAKQSKKCSKGDGKFFLGAALGALAGGVAGILTAPKSGKQTRNELDRAGKKIAKKAQSESKKFAKKAQSESKKFGAKIESEIKKMNSGKAPNASKKKPVAKRKK